MSHRWNGDIWAALTFSAAIAVVVLVLFFLTGCAQPISASSRVAAATPWCFFYCLVTQTSIEDNRNDNLTATVGSASTGGSRTKTITETEN